MLKKYGLQIGDFHDLLGHSAPVTDTAFALYHRQFSRPYLTPFCKPACK